MRRKLTTTDDFDQYFSLASSETDTMTISAAAGFVQFNQEDVTTTTDIARTKTWTPATLTVVKAAREGIVLFGAAILASTALALF